MLEVIIALAAFIQFAVTFYTLYLAFKFKVRGWILIFLAFFLMSIRRLVAVGVLYRTEISEALRAYFLEGIALVISIILFFGIWSLSRQLQRYINALKRTQEQLIQAERLSVLGRITADVAHEIRNPLTSIGGFVKRLGKRLVPGTKEKEYADILVSEVGRLERILRDVLSFSREAKYHLMREDINEVVIEAIEILDKIYIGQPIKFLKNLDASLPPVLIDKDQVRQAVSNLISNAIDAMPGGGRLTINAFMSLSNDVNYIVVSVEDTGIGIPEEKLNRIFEPFYSTKEVGHGTGLGLSICKKIMEEHNGLVRVRSAIGKGSSFSLYFPYQSKEEDAKAKCWDYLKCGIEENKERTCPAYPDFGRICWAVAGTFSDGKLRCPSAYKIGDCRKCGFYQMIVSERRSSGTVLKT